ncbi:dehydrogenase/reductase SDR family member 7 [Bactrocera neohumeralis]|uniref:dehydrogenase/reductase SDR family member 7 n=1 Tax=Bactrocera tryoni TaxID=59916 RepID=UPI001A97CA28|nr:dehydrogenase/reductase SDR family member 7 [Bactrocera tryoni]XP_050318919.1 dehydrogenase/reductase SDR family member 7 [Bactrocera neohumeralis]
MTFLELLFILLIGYYFIYLILWLILDCNVELWYNTYFGLPILSMRGQVVWVTGASSGIGRALALILAKYGVRLVISARRENLLELLKEDCLEQANGLLSEDDILVMPMDVLNISQHEAYFDRVIKYFGRLDVLVNNAGRSQRASWEEIKVQVDRDLFELDVFSVVNLSRIAVRYFLQLRNVRGHIVTTSSIAGLCPVPFSATYCAAKSAINAYLNSLRLEQSGIDVSIFCPGPIATDFLQEAFTAVPQEMYGKSTKGQKRMSAERCATLFATTIANKLELSWCGLFPVNFLTHATRYPGLAKIIFKLMGKSTMNKIREGKL